VVFDGKDTNLHTIWDTAMLEKLVGGYSLEDAQKWAKTLSAAIKKGKYKSQAPGWLEGVDLNDPVSTTMIWATEANKYVCSTVMPNGADAIEGQELDGDYYESAVPVIQLQIARAGYRYVSLALKIPLKKKRKETKKPYKY
jgi:S1/P1 Nuclease